MKFTLLKGPTEEVVYVTQPLGIEIKGKEEMVFKLDKALYGLNQAPRAWNKRIHGFLVHQKFMKYVLEYGVYVKNSRILIICQCGCFVNQRCQHS